MRKPGFLTLSWKKHIFSLKFLSNSAKLVALSYKINVPMTPKDLEHCEVISKMPFDYMQRLHNGVSLIIYRDKWKNISKGHLMEKNELFSMDQIPEDNERLMKIIVR